MLTKSDLIAVAQAIVSGMRQEIDNRNLAGEERFACRGAALRMLENLWFITPTKTREQFDFDRTKFMDLVWGNV